jgi:hypothetical protein
MRMSAVLSVAVVTVVASTPAMSAVSEQRRLACRDQATDIANDYSAGKIYRAEEGDTPSASEVTVIAGGVKYFVPRSTSGVSDSVYTRMVDRNTVYAEEYRRCLRAEYLDQSELGVEPEKRVN